MAHDETASAETTTVSIRLTASQRADWARRALADGRLLSSWIRRQVEQQIAKARQESQV
jgi:hypothetical protein